MTKKYQSAIMKGRIFSYFCMSGQTFLDSKSLKEDAIRLEHLQTIKDSGTDPYPARSKRTHTLLEAKQTPETTTVTVCGRIMARREMGKLTFCHLKDSSGRLQIVFSAKEMSADDYNFFLKNFDIGDFVQITGSMFVTHKGEISVLVKSYTMLAKAILPLPEKWHGLTDVEQRFRKRYLDLIMNEDVSERFKVRSKIISALRALLDSRGFLEIETPTLQPIYGGGFARPFKTHHHSLETDFFLRISDEMYLKRAIVGGLDKVYEITKVFRNEGIDHDHNPEFTMFEAQIAYEDYHFGMDLIEELVEYCAVKALGATEIKHADVTVSVRRPWKRYSLLEAVRIIGKLNFKLDWTLTEAKKALEKHLKSDKKITELSIKQSVGEVLTFAFEELVEEQLIQPTIVYDYPVEVSPLAKKCADPRFTQRFEAFALGSEISNNYSELNDPIDLETRFIAEKKKEAAGFDEAHQTDFDYLEAIKHGMPPTCGIALGVDRVVMLLTGANNIKEVVLFPTLRPEHLLEQKMGKSKETMVAHAVILSTPEVPQWSRLNAAAHLSAALAAREGKKMIHIENTTTTDGEKIPMNIQHAIVMKQTVDRVELLLLKHQAEKAQLVVTCFTEEMRDSSNDVKVKEKQESKTASEINFLGILVFGKKRKVEELTKKFILVN